MSSGKRGTGRRGADDAEEKLPLAGGDAAALALIREADALGEEALENRRKAQALALAVADLWKELKRVAGSETLAAIRAGEEGVDALLARRDALALQRDLLLSSTDSLLARCEQRMGREQAALDWGTPLLDAIFGAPAKGSTVSGLRKGMFDAVEKARKRTEKARDDLAEARVLLVTLRLGGEGDGTQPPVRGRVGLRPRGLD